MALTYQHCAAALLRLELTYAVYQRLQAQPTSEDMLDALRAGTIQHFQIAYELCWKTMQKWAELELPRFANSSRQELFRRLARAGIIEALEPWFAFHRVRNLVLHTYQENVANAVIE